MDVIVKRVNSVAALMDERQLMERTMKAVRHVYLNHLDVAVMVLHQLTVQITKAVAWSLDMVAVRITSIQHEDRNSKIADVNILPMDVVPTIKHQHAAAIMTVAVASMLRMVAVQIS